MTFLLAAALLVGGIYSWLKVQQAIEDLGGRILNEHASQRGKIGRARFGLESGDMIVGNLGTSKRMDYTVIGDNVNLASRLQGLCKYFDCSILVGEGTYSAARGEFLFRVVDRVSVMGRDNDDFIYELVVPLSVARQEDLENARRTEVAFEHFQNRGFLDAVRLDEGMANKRLLDRCEKFLIDPPEADWDGVFRPDFK
jgi:adenylate cyclase